MFNKNDYLTSIELGAILQVADSTVNKWIAQGKISSIKHNKRNLVLKDSIEEIKKNVGYINIEHYIEKKELQSMFKISEDTYCRWLRKGWIKGKVIYAGQSYIPLENLEELKIVTGFIDYSSGWFTSEELAEQLKTTKNNLKYLVRKELISDYKCYNRRHYYPVNTLEELKRTLGYCDKFNEEDYYSLSKAKSILGENFKFYNIKKKINYIEHLGIPFIHKDELKNIKVLLNIDDNFSTKENKYLTARQVAERLSLRIDYIYTLIKRGHFNGAEKVNEVWMIPVTAVNEYEENISSKYNGYLTTKQVGERLHLSSEYVTRLIRDGKLKGAIRNGVNWLIPLSVIKHLEKIESESIPNLESKKNTNDYSSKEVSRILNLTIDSIRLKIKNGTFPNAYLFNKRHYIPVEDVNIYLKEKEELSSYKYTTKDAISELSSYIHSYNTPKRLSKTKELFLSFINIQLNKTRGNPANIKNVKNKLQRIYGLVCKFPNDIVNVGLELIDDVLENEFTDEQNRRIFIQFLTIVSM